MGAITAEKARELGYDVQNDDDVVEVKPQDVVIPMTCTESLFNTTKYIVRLLFLPKNITSPLAPLLRITGVLDLHGRPG